jgi:adenosylcobinamide-GDP ribazoletransferase
MTIDEVWFKERADEFKASILFLTRLRYGPSVPVGGAAIAHAVWAFPLVGILVGLIGAVIYAFAARAGLPPWPAALLAVGATMAATGCLHEDGLADTADGFGGGSIRELKLDIMRDSRIGTYGVCALAMSILLRASALASLGRPGLVAAALIAAHGGARALLPVFMYVVPPARNDGPASAKEPPREAVIVAALLGVLVLFFCLGLLVGLVALILLLAGAGFMAWLTLAQIDGQTADVLGAVEQVGEIVVLLAALH